MESLSPQSRKFVYLVLISLIIVAGVIVVNILAFSRVQQLITQQLVENRLTETKLAATQIEAHITGVRDELITLSKFPLAQNKDSQTCSLSANSLNLQKPEKLEAFLRADKWGQVTACSSPDFVDYLGINIKDKDYFKIPKETREAYLSGIVKQGTNKQIIVAVPLFETSTYTPYPNFLGNFDGLLFSMIEVNQLYYLYLLPLTNGKESTFLLLDGETNEVILEGENIESYGNITELLPKKGETSLVKELSGGSTIITSSDLIFGKERWKLVLLTPLDKVKEEVGAVQKGHLFSLILVVLSIGVILFFTLLLYRSKEKIQSKLEQAQVTLEKLGIKAEVESGRYSAGDLTLEPGKVYLVKDQRENTAQELFLSALNRGFAGLGLVREDPRLLRKKYNLQKTPFIWLTTNPTSEVPCERKIEVLISLIQEFLKKSPHSVIFIEGMDYLISENGFENVIKNIHYLKDLSGIHQSIVILSVSPETLDTGQLQRLEASTVDAYGAPGSVEITSTEKEILRFINDRNITNTLVSFGDINKQFDITKPTTRAKISRLQMLGLVQTDTLGRFKSLKITSKGRKMI
ncbi:MAG: DUF835 domain-containing protein [Nanoarchaeota archaeon]